MSRKRRVRKPSGEAPGLTPADLGWLTRAVHGAVEAGDWDATRRMVEVAAVLKAQDRDAVRAKINRDVRTVPAFVDRWPGKETVWAEVQARRQATGLPRLQSKLLRVVRATKGDVEQAQMLDHAATDWHPWEGRGDLRRRFEDLKRGKDYRSVSAWRRWTYRWWRGQRYQGELPTWMRVPEKTRDVEMPKTRKLKTDTTLTARDRTHELGERHELRQMFEALPRHEQIAIARLTRVATGSVPLWLVAREVDPSELARRPRGRPKFLTDQDKQRKAAVRQARRRAKQREAAEAERAVAVTLYSVSQVSQDTRD